MAFLANPYAKAWRLFLATDPALSFVQTLYRYTPRWTVNVLFTEMKEHLRLEQCQSRHLDKKIGHATPCGILIFTVKFSVALLLDCSKAIIRGQGFSAAKTMWFGRSPKMRFRFDGESLIDGHRSESIQTIDRSMGVSRIGARLFWGCAVSRAGITPCNGLGPMGSGSKPGFLARCLGPDDRRGAAGPGRPNRVGTRSRHPRDERTP